MSSRYTPFVSWSLARQGRRRYSVHAFYWTFLVFIALATVSWTLGALGKDEPITQAATGAHDLFARGSEPECRLVRQVKDQCSFVRTNCPDHEDGLFSYLQFYYCSLPHAKPVAFILLVLWLCLLFNTIGIAASDFLCINLSTLASVLGLSESLTGVTFLAFGNGSPDVFSTFAAMRSNSGSLAIGELIGAATFITSVVAGSMALVRPFKVARRSFVRDVGFFVIAVSFSTVLMADGHIRIWESAVMVGLYCFYVAMVVTWHWYLVRQRRTYERNLAARSHFHIPDNQELDIEEPAEDDDPGVGSESRSLLRGASTEDFDALERSGLPAWTDGEEDDETRNRYLAEIRENMHIYRPNSRRRKNTALNPIRPSLVGALEFQSVLSSLQKSRNIHQNLDINLDRYSDDPEARPSRDLDNRSIASHSRVYPSSADDYDREGSARTRAVSANDAAGLRLDTSVFGQNARQPVQVTVSRPSGEAPDDTTQSPQIDRGALGPSSSVQSSRSPSLKGAAIPSQDPELLAPPHGFRSPNYQGEISRPRSPLHVSPRGTAVSPGASDAPFESLSSPFPPFLDVPESTSSRAPSIRPRASSSPTERLQVHDGLSDYSNHPSRRFKWWPYWMLPPPESLFSALFPTLADWKIKNIWERLLGVIAAPTVMLLTITVPVMEPAQSETVSDPIPVVVTSADDMNGSAAPRVRLPDDSPIIRPLDHHPDVEQRRATNDNGKVQSPTQGRRRVDSEVPLIELPEDATPPVAKEWNQWLVAVQLFVGPFFIALVAWTAIDPEYKPRSLLLPALVALLFSLLGFTMLQISTRHALHTQPPKPWRPLLALLGFVVAISWIATIAAEVVNLLKAVGVILNISDSLLGLTVFAVGNSLGDLVADITVARLGYPVMALSACFGGPMMNILLGIGLGGLYMTINADPDMAVATGAYEIAISKVLVISVVTLLIILVGLLIVVPLNKWWMDRKIGWGLVILWSVGTLGNVIAEAVW